MREIKFRVWVGGIMFEDTSIYQVTKSGNGQPFINLGIKRLQKKGVVFMQYTGLKDKNGKEIYEGDIVYFDRLKVPYEIWFERGFFQTRDSEGRSGYHGIWNFEDGGMEVIGNVFENKDLLNQK